MCLLKNVAKKGFDQPLSVQSDQSLHCEHKDVCFQNGVYH